MNFKNLEIRRFTVHKIYGKSATNAVPYAETCTDFCKIGTDGDDILHKRILASLDHRTKFFELDLEESGKGSFFEIHKPLWGATKPSFIKISQLIADKAAEAQTKTNIPDGLLLVIEAKVDNLNTIISVKAEKSHAFSMTGNNLKLIKDIFLSSDKTLYKLGFFLKKDAANSTAKSYRYFVYDDAFTPAKDDLAFYFYSRFLGLTTDKNSKIQTNQFHKFLTDFATEHIEFPDKMEVMRNIDRAFMDPERKSLKSEEFELFFPEEVRPLFKTVASDDFPTAIVKNNEIVNGLKTKKISISASTTLYLKNNPEGLLIGNTNNKDQVKRMKTILDSGTNFNFVAIPTGLASNTTTLPNEQTEL